MKTSKQGEKDCRRIRKRSTGRRKGRAKEQEGGRLRGGG